MVRKTANILYDGNSRCPIHNKNSRNAAISWFNVSPSKNKHLQPGITCVAEAGKNRSPSGSRYYPCWASVPVHYRGRPEGPGQSFPEGREVLQEPQTLLLYFTKGKLCVTDQIFIPSARGAASVLTAWVLLKQKALMERSCNTCALSRMRWILFLIRSKATTSPWVSQKLIVIHPFFV